MNIDHTRSATKRTGCAALGAVLLLLLASACGPRAVKPYTSSRLGNGGALMAILPFENLSQTNGAGRSMESFVLTEFLKHAPVIIVDPGEVMAVLADARVRLATNIPRDTLLAIGKQLGVDWLLIGTVHDFDKQASAGAGAGGRELVVSLSLRVLDARTGQIVWAANSARTGRDRETLFGVGRSKSLNDLGHEVASAFGAAFAASLKRTKGSQRK